MKVLFVEWCAKDVLDGTQNMDALTELAYRRIIDMIYSTNDKLLDNDKVLQYSTKTGRKWKQIKHELIEVHQKIFIEDGFIRNSKCSFQIQKSAQNIEQKRQAGLCSVKARKSLKNNETGSTAVETAVETPVITAVPTNQEPKNPIKKKKNKTKKRKEDFEEFWNLCPRKVGKGDAEKKYWVARQEIGKERLHQAMKIHATEVKDKEKEFIPHPSTWLNKKRYYDETEIKAQTKDKWNEWHYQLAARIGENDVHSWFGQANALNGILYLDSDFKKSWVVQNFQDDLLAIGINEIKVQN